MNYNDIKKYLEDVKAKEEKEHSDIDKKLKKVVIELGEIRLGEKDTSYKHYSNISKELSTLKKDFNSSQARLELVNDLILDVCKHIINKSKESCEEKEKYKYSDEEIGIIKDLISMGYKYIARDKNGALAAYTVDVVKKIDKWYYNKMTIGY